VQVGTDFIFGVEHAGELAVGHGEADGHGEIANEIEAVGVEHGAFDDFAAKRIGAVEDEEGDFAAGGFFHGIGHGGLVGVEAYAGVLDIEDEGVDAAEHVVGEAARFAVETVNGQAGGGVGGVGDFFVELAADAVFGAEQRDESDARGAGEKVDGGAAVAGNAGVVGDEADAAATKGSEVLLDEDVKAGLHTRSLCERNRGLKPRMNTDKNRN